MRNNKIRKEDGSVEVEATFILPIAILCVILLLYLALFLFQRANLQVCLETSLIYYKNTVTDTFVVRNDEVTYVKKDDSYIGTGNSYSATEPRNPYIGMHESAGTLESDEQFQDYFRSVAGKMLFDDELSVTIDYSNYLLVKQFEVTATQMVTAPIDFSMIGVDNKYEISATARVVVSDHDETIRNVDYIIDILDDTAVGDMARNFAAKVSAGYQKLKDVLGAS